MMALTLAILSCIGFGMADILTGIASRQGKTIPVTLVSQAAGLIVMTVTAMLLGGIALPTDYISGAVAGCLLLAGIIFLIEAFRDGLISVVAPIVGVISILIPVLYGMANGVPINLGMGLGLMAGIVAIILVNQGDKLHRRPNLKSFVSSIAAGGAFGGFVVALSFSSANSGLWPLLVCYTLRMLLLAFFMLVTGQVKSSLQAVTYRMIPAAAGSGVVLAFASGALLVSLQLGCSVIVAGTLSNEAPIITVLLALMLLDEKINAVQAAGVVLAGISLFLVASA